MAQYIIAELLVHSMDFGGRPCNNLKQCFSRNRTFLQANFFTGGSDIIMTAIDMRFSDSDEEPFTNDEAFLYEIASKIETGKYNLPGFFSAEAVISPNLAEPFPFGTAIRDLKKPFTNPPERRRLEVPAAPRHPVDRDFEAAVMEKRGLVRRGLLDRSEIEGAERELAAQYRAAGITPVKSMGGRRRGSKTRTRKSTARRFLNTRKTVRKSRSKSRRRTSVRK